MARAALQISFAWVGVGLAACGPGPEALERAVEGAGAVGDFRPRGALAIYAIDVGNGDATLVLGPEDRRGERRSMLIDAGKLRADGGRIVNAVLDGAGVGRLDYVVATHYDSDHIGGFVHVLGSESVLWADERCTPGPHAARGAIIDLGDWPATSKTIEQYLACVDASARRGVEHVVVRGGAHIGRRFELGGGYAATVVAGDGYVIDRAQPVPYVNTPNEHSIAIWVSGPGGFDFLVTGDLVGRRHGSENALAEPVLAEALAGRGVDLEVLRVGHHGGDNATSDEVLSLLRPEVGLISVSAQNHFGHPGCAALEALADGAVQLVAQTQAGATACAVEPRLAPEVADGTIGVFVTGGTYEVVSVGDVSGATGRQTRPFAHRCGVDRACASAGAAPAGPPRPGDVVFTELMANPAARSDADGEWFELTATDPGEGYDLSGCWLRDDDRDAIILRDGLLVPPGGAITLAKTGAPGFTPTYVYGAGLTLANAADELELVCDGAVIDRVAWSAGFSIVAGASASLDPAATDARANDDPRSWCTSTLEYATDRGTPNGPNPPCR